MDNLETQATLETHHREKTNKTKNTTQKIARTPLNIRRLTQALAEGKLFLFIFRHP